MEEGKPNQDAWFGARGAFGTAIAVCDGLGSKANSAVGSKMGCKAVMDALRYWSRYNGAPLELAIRLLHTMWGIRVHPADLRESATTCLFAATIENGPLWVAQLGDGLILIQNEEGVITPLKEESKDFTKDFSNETTGLGIAADLTEWKIERISDPKPGTMVVLLTDGVSADLLPEKYGEFLRYLREDVAPLPPRRRWMELAHELRHWPVPNHADDKTIALLWREG